MANHTNSNSSGGVFILSNSYKNALELNDNLKSGDAPNNRDYQYDVDQNQLTTNSEDLRNLSREVREFVLNNPTQLKAKPDIKRESGSSKDGSLSIYDQIEEHQRYVINKEVVRKQEEHITSTDDNWGWIVVLGSLICMVFVDGICFTYGLHFEHIKSYFMLSDISLAILPGSLLSGLYLITSPLANPLANYFGYRFVAMVGCMCTTIALLISSFCRSYLLFILFFGVLSGIGFGLMYLPAIAIVAHWFNQKRAVAIGIALCGSGIGTCLLSFLLPEVIKWVHWNGSLIILSAMCCQTLVAIAFFRPYELHQRIKQLRRDYKQWCIQNEEYIKEMKRLKKEERLSRASAKEQRRREKLLKKKQIVIKRGSIFTRIMEEKSRQRTVSTGSLDGMMITQMNQLVNASQVDMNGIMQIGSVASLGASLLPSYAIDRVIEATLKKMKASSKNINRKKSSASESISMSKKSSSNSISEMISNNENVVDDIPISLVKEYVAKQKSSYNNENSDMNNGEISFKLGSTVLLNTVDENHKTNFLCTSQSSVSSQSNKPQTVTPSTEGNSDQVSLKVSLELPCDIKKFVHVEIMKELDRPVNRKDLYFTGSLHQFLNSKNSIANSRYLSFTNFNQNNLPACPYSCPAMDTTHKTDMEFSDTLQNNYTPIKSKSLISDIVDFSIMRSCAFQMLIVSSVAMMLGFFVPFFYVPILLADESIRWTSGTLFALGFSNIIGRLVATIYIEKGWALRYDQANGANLTVLFLGLSSVSILLMPYVRLIHVSLVIILAFVYGFCIAMIVSIRSMLVVELFGVENLTKTFTFLLIFQGLSAIVGPILSGFICQHISFMMNTAEPAFLCSGFLFLLSTISAYALKRLKTRFNTEVKYPKMTSMSASAISGQMSSLNPDYNPQTTQTTNLMMSCD